MTSDRGRLLTARGSVRYDVADEAYEVTIAIPAPQDAPDRAVFVRELDEKLAGVRKLFVGAWEMAHPVEAAQ